jgi:hypothetical protein
MSDEKKHEKWCISPCISCPECDASRDSIWYDNEETNEWGSFRDAWCMECGIHWCEITDSDEHEDE